MAIQRILFLFLLVEEGQEGYRRLIVKVTAGPNPTASVWIKFGTDAEPTLFLEFLENAAMPRISLDQKLKIGCCEGSRDFLETDLTNTFLDAYLPENVDLLNILTNNISESSFQMLRRYFGGKFHIAAAISQLARWWNYAELAESGRDPKLHAANSKAMGKGGAFWEAGAVV